MRKFLTLCAWLACGAVAGALVGAAAGLLFRQPAVASPTAGPTITNPITHTTFAQPLDLRSPVRGYIGPDSCAHAFIAAAWPVTLPGEPLWAVARTGGVVDTVRAAGQRCVDFVTETGELYQLALRPGATPAHLGSVWQLPAAKRRHHARR